MRTGRHLLFLLISAAACLPGAAVAQTPIHQCKDADGGIVYSQLPCKDEKPAKEAAPADNVDEPVVQAPPRIPAEFTPPDDTRDEPESDESAAECKKRYRDAIDEIDAEIRRAYTPDKDAEYKQRLLALTRQLRAC